MAKMRTQSREQPHVVLLLEGVNDLTNMGKSAIMGMVDNPRLIIRLAEEWWCYARLCGDAAAATSRRQGHAPEPSSPANNFIRFIAGLEGATSSISTRDSAEVPIPTSAQTSASNVRDMREWRNSSSTRFRAPFELTPSMPSRDALRS